jgi:hypothetical protein
MKKIILIVAFFFALVPEVSAQFDFSDKPFKAPKKAVNLAKAGEQVKMKVGQMAYYQWTRQSNMDGFSIGITDGMDNLKSSGTHIFTDTKTRNKITTWQWKALQKGTAKMEIQDEAGKERYIIVVIE